MSTLVWRVLAYNSVRRLWTVRSMHSTQDEACEHAEALQHRHRYLRVRVVPATRHQRRQIGVIPPINDASRLFRLSQLTDEQKRR